MPRSRARSGGGQPIHDARGAAPDPADDAGGQPILEWHAHQIEPRCRLDDPALVDRPAVVYRSLATEADWSVDDHRRCVGETLGAALA